MSAPGNRPSVDTPNSNHASSDSSVFSYSVSTESNRSVKREFTCELLAMIGSIFYGLLLVVLAGVFYLTDMTNKTVGKHQLFNITLASVGLAFLGFLHYDVQKYKNKVLKELFPKDGLPSSRFDPDRMSIGTEVACNTISGAINGRRSASMGSITAFMPAYRFLRGQHSGSFYLKCGMAAFCFGHIVHEGLRFGHQIFFFATGDSVCASVPQLILYTIRPLYSFYQLFMTFKYSNIIISKYIYITQFGVMHLFGTSLAFWLGAIIDDATDWYYLFHNKDGTLGDSPGSSLVPMSLNESAPFEMDTEVSAATALECLQSTSPSVQTSQILPYMYPFAIEYNLCLAALWFMVWYHIGKDSNNAHPHPFQHKVSEDRDGNADVQYESNFVIKADCHASNRGLFAGLSVLLFCLITMILFFVVAGGDNKQLPMYIHHTQEYLLTVAIMGATLFAYWHTARFDINPFTATSHTMDIILLLIPIPFYLLNNILAVIADINYQHWSRVVLMLLILFQVILQTLFIVDAMHRCAQSRRLRFQKPGREFITASIMLNVTSWIIYTFETKAAESLHNEVEFYGENIWMIISHTTLPLMLFYRFHASVCLSSVWSLAYEKAHPS